MSAGSIDVGVGGDGVAVAVRAVASAPIDVTVGLYVLVEGDDPLEWAMVLERFDSRQYVQSAIRQHAERFAAACFEERMAALLLDC